MSNLLLTRRVNETVNIGDEITVTVVSMHGGQVRLAFSAPAHIRIDRSEVRDRINAENDCRVKA